MALARVKPLMSDKNEAILEKANSAISKGDYEGFLTFCTEDTEWTFTGDTVLKGKEAVREWMTENYTEPPDFMVERFIAVDDSVVAMGKIWLRNGDGEKTEHAYCDVWRFRDGKMCELRAFVVPDGG